MTQTPEQTTTPTAGWEEEFQNRFYDLRSGLDCDRTVQVKAFIRKTREEAKEEGRKEMIYSSQSLQEAIKLAKEEARREGIEVAIKYLQDSKASSDFVNTYLDFLSNELRQL